MITGTLLGGVPATAPADLLSTAAVLRRLELEITRRLEGLLAGEHLSAVLGPGTERAGARRFEPGDDARRIDWNLSARALEPHVRTTEADRELETTIVVDRSASLDLGTAKREKRELALAAVAAFGVLTVRSGNRMRAVLAGGDQLVRLPARHDRRGVFATLAAVHESPRRAAAPNPDADLAAALRAVDAGARRRGLVVVVSDFLDRPDPAHAGWPAGLRRLALRHSVIGVQVRDPRELTLPAVGLLTLVDTETGRRIDVQTNSAKLRARYAAAARERDNRIRREIISAGAQHVVLSTDGDWVLELARFVTRHRAVQGR